jgi:microcystin-dependent protein
MSTLNEVVNLPNFGVANGIVNRTSWQDNLKAPLAVPAGSIIMYAGYTGPSGYFLCDGRAVSRYLYTDLFNAIGTTYGAGNGTSTFNIPNFKSYTPVCMDTSVPEFSSLGQTGGEIEHTLTLSEMPIHLHSGPTDPAGEHYHTGTTDSAGSHTHGVTDPGHTHTYLGVNSQGAASGLDNVAENSPRPTETTSSSVTGISINASGVHTHDFTTTTELDHIHELTTTTSGGDQPHNNLQPYIVMNFIIKF